MTRDRRRKRRARARAAKTGESYTAALRNLRRSEELPMPTDTTTNHDPRTFDAGGATDIGRVREINEDHFLARPDLAAVADGMGGHGRGEIASRLAIETLEAAFVEQPTATGLIEAVGRANQAVRDRALSDDGPGPDDGAGDGADDNRPPPGTTLAAVALVDGDRLVVVNVGDSRVYRFRDGALTRLSADHSQVADLVRAGEIGESEAADHPDRHVLTLAVGLFDRVAPHVAHLRPEPGDRLLVCTDGLFNEVGNDELVTVLATVTPARAAARDLVARARSNGGSDNATAVVLDVT